MNPEDFLGWNSEEEFIAWRDMMNRSPVYVEWVGSNGRLLDIVTEPAKFELEEITPDEFVPVCFNRLEAVR